MTILPVAMKKDKALPKHFKRTEMFCFSSKKRHMSVASVFRILRLSVNAEHASIAQEFFGDLIHPKEFPRDYVGFVKKIMKLLQHKFYGIVRIELVLQQVEDSELLYRPCTSSADDSSSDKLDEITEEKVIEILEFLYPNPVTIQYLVRQHEWDEDDVREILNRLQVKKIVKSVEQGAYTRVTQGDAEVKIVRQMPQMVWAHQPTIAIITAHFTEKLAVNAMMENKETFMRYTTVGSGNYGESTRFGKKNALARFIIVCESNVYTLGTICDHRIVCTKLPSIGQTREAMTAAGNTTTRLLGTFQSVHHVILVGVGGGVPHFTDYNKHVRLGDVVVSHASPKSEVKSLNGYLYDKRDDLMRHLQQGRCSGTFQRRGLGREEIAQGKGKEDECLRGNLARGKG
ncbi:hypothetical protein RUM43_000080 [Polyplax serrata]|uniref:Winged helix-turn-helix domain-containing protein n=1 Tax=Polyplax serrata TaxID=468196 RepID=A0AAN8SC96_POLSC